MIDKHPCSKCGKPAPVFHEFCANCLDVESELMAMLQEPTAVTVQRKQTQHDAALMRTGRALAPLINAHLARLADEIQQTPKEPE